MTFPVWGHLMFDTATTALLRAVLDEVCESVSRARSEHEPTSPRKSWRPPPEARFPRGPQAGRPQSPVPRADHVALIETERGVNFQVTVLKILVSYPEGFAVMDDIKRDMAILATSGRDWADRTKRLAARVLTSTYFPRAWSNA